MSRVIDGCRFALKNRGSLVFVLADNKVAQRTIPVVKIVQELLSRQGFADVNSIRRRIRHCRRRYPFGFNGIMKSEAVIRARKVG